MEEIYFQTVIPRVTYCIGAWGSWSVAIFTEMENSHIKVGTNIHKNSKNYLDHENLDLIKWQDWGYLYERRLVIEVFKVKQGLNSRLLPFVIFTESKRKGPLLEIKLIKQILRGTVSISGPRLYGNLFTVHLGS